MLTGGCLLVFGYRCETFGFVTGFFLIPLGASGGVFDTWRRERGLWMLSCAFLALFLPIYTVFEYHMFTEGIGSGLTFSQALDFLVATTVLLFQIRLFVTVARLNWLIFRNAACR
jgi:hypothetical protein